MSITTEHEQDFLKLRIKFREIFRRISFGTRNNRLDFELIYKPLVVLIIHDTVQLPNKQETHQEMRDPNVTSLYFATPLTFNAPDRGVPLGRSP